MQYLVDDPDVIELMSRAERILILGSSGSGKTHLSKQLGPLLRLPVVQLDEFFWKPGWQPTQRNVWERTLTRLIAQPKWIMDGAYERSLPIRLPRADWVIFLDASRWLCLWRTFVRRYLANGQHAPNTPHRQPFHWSGVRYIWEYPKVWKPWIRMCLDTHGPSRLLQLNSSEEIEHLLERLRCYPKPCCEVHEPVKTTQQVANERSQRDTPVFPCHRSKVS